MKNMRKTRCTHRPPFTARKHTLSPKQERSKDTYPAKERHASNFSAIPAPPCEAEVTFSDGPGQMKWKSPAKKLSTSRVKDWCYPPRV